MTIKISQLPSTSTLADANIFPLVANIASTLTSQQATLAVLKSYVLAGSKVTIGTSAGETSQGTNAIAIGYFAGKTSQAANTIILNASGSEGNHHSNASMIKNSPAKMLLSRMKNRRFEGFSTILVHYTNSVHTYLVPT